ncbi:hypothetical protein [Streptomyces sp. NPDC050264]|uniref:hypothetical protein n=1 Tax=Streptomyces sp. NPDC050264 TaxID=3155038 RepID=UPI00342C6FC7
MHDHEIAAPGGPSRRSVLAVGSALLALAVTPAAAAPRTSPADRVRPRLPAPTGPCPVGTTALHLVDRSRRDPWTAGPVRELMVDVRYPARSVTGYRRAPQMTAREAAAFDGLNNFEGLAVRRPGRLVRAPHLRAAGPQRAASCGAVLARRPGPAHSRHDPDRRTRLVG